MSFLQIFVLRVDKFTLRYILILLNDVGSWLSNIFLEGDKIMSTNKITCSFTVDRDIYNAYKSIVVKGGENVKGNLIRYMLNVINYETPNADTISAIKEVEELKKNPNKKTYASFRELLEDITNE